MAYLQCLLLPCAPEQMGESRRKDTGLRVQLASQVAFPQKFGVPFCVDITRTIVFEGLYWGPLNPKPPKPSTWVASCRLCTTRSAP